MKTTDRHSGVGSRLCGCVVVMTTLLVAACAKGPRTETVVRGLTGAPVTWNGGEMLLRPTDRSVTVKAIAAQPVEVYFEYGPYAGGATSTTTPVTFNTST